MPNVLPALALSIALSRGAKSPVTLSYSVLSNGSHSGSEVDTYFSNGKIDCAYEFNDRGRGPRITGHYELDKSGLPVRVDLTGVDYLKAPVDEHFAVSGGMARWKSTSEKGEAKAGGFYVSNNPCSPENAFLASALIRARRSIPLYPGGEARLEKLTDTTLSLNGRSIHVTDYAIWGLYFTPTTLWLDDRNQFFGVPGDWEAILRKGWEGANHKLLLIDRGLENKRYSLLGSALSEQPKHPVAFCHVTLFDSQRARSLRDQTVVVRGSKIDQVGPSTQVKVPTDAIRIYDAGKTLLPGLFDMHAHLSNPDGLLDIAGGVTSARDMGNDIDSLNKLQTNWDSGKQVGPRIFKAGLIDGRGPFQCPTGLYASTQQEALADVNRYADKGYIQIKLYSSLNPAFVPEIAKLAHRRGLRVSGHVPQGLIASQFVGDGADEIQHMNFIMLNFLADKVKDTRTPERFTAVAKLAGGIDQDSQQVKDFIDLLLAHHTTVDATVATFEPMFCARPGVCSPSLAPVLDRLPAQVQRSAFAGGLPVTPETDQVYRDSYAALLRMLKLLYSRGVPILAGTDELAGFTLHRELELEVQAGIPASKALQIATWNAAKLLGRKNSLGSIEPGKIADLLLVAGNPEERISDIRRGRMVMKNGVLFRCDRVYAAAGIKPSK